MRDIFTLLREAMANGEFDRIANDGRAQFDADQDGNPAYVGATLLPEVMQDANKYREEGIRYRTIVANSGTRYSPTQKKGGDLYGTMDVELGESDIQREMTGREYDALLSFLRNGASMDAMGNILRWADTVLLRALLDYNELQRWQAIVNAQVVRVGSNAYTETVQYPDPAGHRVTIAGGALVAPTGWYDPTEDPFDDIHAMADLLYDRGYAVNRIITSRQLVAVLARHPMVRTRTGITVIDAAGDLAARQGRATMAGINAALAADGLPPIEQYERRYRNESGTARFLPATAFVMAGTTGRNEVIDLGDDEPVPVRETLGYTGIGRAAGQSNPGRIVRVEAFENKPPRLEGEAWQTSLPVITEPEAIGVLTVTAPA